ncbi:uncharacterized protein LOC121505007 [Cheilinus undulatus]|uniref:uncharacterized protein LOC121505007 n=1 Tax=Cheilinus undulatus TaxID=241271 RepID=UPI001BD48CD3|nr:uncharacterized protein LOC121505007 [Cheilinus undulatus]
MGNRASSYDTDPTLPRPRRFLTSRPIRRRNWEDELLSELARLELAEGERVDSARPVFTPRTQNTVLGRRVYRTRGSILPFYAEPPRHTVSTEGSGPEQQLARPLSPRQPTPSDPRATHVSRPEPVTWPDTQRAGQERCYDPNDTRFTFVDGEDDMDFEYNEYKSLRAKMSCGHTVTPSSLINWCRRQLEEGKTEFVCGQTDCNAVWSCNEVFEMTLLTPEEIEYVEKKLFEKAAKAYLDVKKCPGCNSLALREDVNDVRVCCTVCTRNKGKLFEFCWLCSKEWKCPSPYPDRCAEPDCVGKPETILKTCPVIVFKDIKNVTGCPSIRACPTCGFLIEHNKKCCKNIICSRCKVEFCFVCLKRTPKCLKTSSYLRPCSAGVAPRQTSIPVWYRNLP